MPANAPSTGWGLIACQTVEHYRVDNCRTLGESPLGSGMARAVRQAESQFLVRPPRIGGRLVVGAWERIRIAYTDGVTQLSAFWVWPRLPRLIPRFHSISSQCARQQVVENGLGTGC